MAAQFVGVFFRESIYCIVVNGGSDFVTVGIVNPMRMLWFGIPAKKENEAQ